jgi:hypothetical protein
MSELPEFTNPKKLSFEEYKAQHPDFFPEGTPLEKQHAFFKNIETLNLQQVKDKNILRERIVTESTPQEEITKDVLPAPRYVIEVVNQKTLTTKRSFDYTLYADVLTKRLSIVYFNKTFYTYDTVNHIYRENMNEIETVIRNDYVRFGIDTPFPQVKTNVIEHLNSMGGHLDFPFNNNCDCIPVENGVIKIDYKYENIELLCHGPEHMFTYKLAATYNPDIGDVLCLPLLERMVDKNDLDTLIQIPAQALLQMQTGNSYKKAYLIQGEPHAGKTSFLKLLYGLFGESFISQISLQQLCENQFVGGTLESKLLNIFDDLEDVALNVIDQFKAITGDCRYSIERKFQSSYTGKVTAVHIFTCNYPPEYPERVKRDAAFWARWEYLKFPFEYPVDPNFYDEWYTQDRISSYLNAVLKMMLRIKKRGLPTNSPIDSVMMNWSINSDPIYDFITLNFDVMGSKNQQYYSKSKLHQLYLNWCDEHKIPEHKQRKTLKSFVTAIQQHEFLPYRLREKKENYEVFVTTKYIAKRGIDLDYHASLGL